MALPFNALCTLTLMVAQTNPLTPKLPLPGLTVHQFPQRMSARYTAADGLPAGAFTIVRLEGAGVQVSGPAGSALFTNGRWKSGPPVAAAAIDVSTPGLPTGVHAIQVAKAADGTEWVVTDRGLYRSMAGRLRPFEFPTSYLTAQATINPDSIPSCVAVDANNTVWIGTQLGIYATDGANWWNPINREEGLPFEDVTCMAFGPRGELWVGTSQGVCRMTSAGRWMYYNGPRWLPNSRVNAIAAAPDGSAWVATNDGVAHLYDREMTLAQKAEHYQKITDERHNRYGFVTESILKVPGRPEKGVTYEASDNDGLWTAVYVGAESFRWAATHDPKARELAHKSMWAMMDLMNYSGVPGFPARAIFHKGETVDGYDPNETVRLPGETDKIWYQSPVDPNVMCKQDTSSDELDGHFFAYSVYYDLVADAAEKPILAAHVRAIMDNLLSHNYNLVGPTGRRTLWGVFGPQELNDNPTWWEERGLNSLSALTYLTVTAHITGDPKYTAALKDLIEHHHYLLNSVYEKIADPWYMENHSDDQMAFMSRWAITHTTTDPATRTQLILGLNRSWKSARPERSPFFNFVYGSVTGAPCDVPQAVQSLEDWPWELMNWQCTNTQRADVGFRSVNIDADTKVETTRVLPYSERVIMQWNGNPYEPNGGSVNGNAEDDGSAWLLPYWMGRYYGFIRE
ncbi:MAG: hypothetical protein KGJ62_00290 [Armatimonadetes bacterium]|nr:hypothetical protein [Armatimonadota bacterium]MDE2206062.1 hypothetical protein [Armatimonadota bacterium]